MVAEPLPQLHEPRGDADPQRTGQDLGSPFGKILRIDPLGKNSRNGKYGIPTGNPFVGHTGALGEIYAYGFRNAHRLSWDLSDGTMFALPFITIP